MLEFNEALPQDFTFIGQWGVTADRELRDIYWMRSRHYDVQLGRFLSFDPLGKSAFKKYYKPSDFQNNLNSVFLRSVNSHVTTIFNTDRKQKKENSSLAYDMTVITHFPLCRQAFQGKASIFTHTQPTIP